MDFGIFKNEATATNRGFNYQAYLTALAWARLQHHETLVIEVAEDFAIAKNAEVLATQVKDEQSSSLTLLHAREFLNDAATLLSQPSKSKLTIVYHTTSELGTEKELKHRPNGRAAIAEWNDVRNGGKATELIAVVDRLIAANKPEWAKVRDFKSNRSDAEFKSDFIDRIVWAYEQPPSDSIEAELREKIADIALEEFGVPKNDGRTHANHVLQQVRHLSAEADRKERRATRADLLELLKRHAVVSVLPNDLTALRNDSEKLKTLPINVLDQIILDRIEWLTKVRFFPEAKAENAAQQLSLDVSDGGAFALCSAQVRADALLLTTRLLLVNAFDESKVLLQRAMQLDSTSDNFLTVDALVTGNADQQAGLKKLFGKNGVGFNAYRFAIRSLSNPMNALKWLIDSALSAADFDADGNARVLLTMLSAEQWDQAIEWRSRVDAKSLPVSPALMFACASADLLSGVYPEDRARAISAPPVFGEIQYVHTAAGIEARECAATLFRTFSAVAAQFRLPIFAQIAHEHALSLDLADITSRAKATQEIKSLYDPEKSPQSFEWVPLFLQVAQLANLDEIKNNLLRLWMRNGELRFHESRALFVLLRVIEPSKWLDRSDDIKQALVPAISPEAIVELLVSAYVDTKQLDRARDEIAEAGLASTVQEELSAIVLDAKGVYPQIDLPTEPLLGAQRLHLRALIAQGDRTGALKLQANIFEKTKYIPDAEALLEMQIAAHDFQYVRDFFLSYPLFSLASQKLRQRQFHALHALGDWKTAQTILKPLDSGETINPQLLQDLEVQRFDWEALGQRIRNIRAQDISNVGQLMYLAEQSQFLSDSQLTLDFVRRAIELDPLNADLLMVAYTYKALFGVEDDAEAGHWIKAAIANKTEKSSIWTLGLDDIAAQSGAWQRQNSAINSGIAKAEMPLAIVADANNSTLTKLYLERIEENLSQPEPHKRGVVSAFAGVQRDPMPAPAEVVIDASALLLLAKLDLLELLPKCFAHIHVHHGLGHWLLAEVGKIPFHQPSKIKDAIDLQHLLASHHLRIAEVTKFPPSALVEQVGKTLAQLIVVARRDFANNSEAFVVHPGIVHRPESLGRIAAEIPNDARRIVSTRPIVDALTDSGALTSAEISIAIDYLGKHDKCWGSEAELPSGSKLYLDELAITYLQSTAMLNPICQSRFQVFIHPDKARECDTFVKIQKINERQRKTIDRLRTWLKTETTNGFVVALPKVAADLDLEPDSISTKSLSDFLFGAARAPVFIVDDRALNKASSATHKDGSSSAIRTTLDVLGWLHANGDLTQDQLSSKRMELRKSGVMFVPFEADELYAAVTKSKVTEGIFKESYEARGLREYALLAQSSGLLEISVDYPWLSNLTRSAMLVLRRLWEAEDLDIAATEIKSDWLIELSQIQVFNETEGVEFAESAIEQLKASILMSLLSEAWRPAKQAQRFIKWIDVNHFQRIKANRPNNFRQVCMWLKDLYLRFANDSDSPDKSHVLEELLKVIPTTVFDVLRQDTEFANAYSLNQSYSITLSAQGEPTFDLEAFYRATRSVLEAPEFREVADRSGVMWSVGDIDGGVVRASEIGGTREFDVSNSGLFSPNIEIRERVIETVLENAGLDGREASYWRTLCHSTQLDHHQIFRLHQQSQLTPRAVSRRLETLFASSVTWEALLEHSDEYFERLVGKWEPVENLAAFATRTIGYAYGATKSQKLKCALLRSIHSSLTPRLLINTFSAEELTIFVDQHFDSLDLWSQCGLLEGLASRAQTMPEDVGQTLETVIQLFYQCVTNETHLALTCSLAGFVAGDLNMSRRFHQQPPFWRRLAAFAHAAQIECTLLKACRGQVLGDKLTQLSQENEFFKVCTMVEMRLEPRWGAFLLTPQQLQQELVGRAIGALTPVRAIVTPLTCGKLIYGEADITLEKIIHYARCFLPGPLEGAVREFDNSANEIDDIAQKLMSDESTPLIHRFEHSIQIGMAGSIPHELQIGLIELLKTMISTEITDSPSNGWTNLATMMSLVAAGSRNQELARLSIHYLKSMPSISFDLKASVCLACCAWAQSMPDWTK